MPPRENHLPAAQAATTRTTLEIPVPEGLDRAEATTWVNEINGRNDLLSDTIREESAKHPVNLPGAVVDPPDFDGTLAVTSTGLALTIESDVAAGARGLVQELATGLGPPMSQVRT